MNDIALEVDSSSNINLLADDTKIFSHSNTILQNSLDKIYNWLKERKLNLNPGIYQVLNIQKNTTISTFDFKINNTNLSSIKMFKDLGIFVAENLKRKHQISYLFRISSTTSFQVLKSFKSSSLYKDP